VSLPGSAPAFRLRSGTTVGRKQTSIGIRRHRPHRNAPATWHRALRNGQHHQGAGIAAPRLRGSRRPARPHRGHAVARGAGTDRTAGAAGAPELRRARGRPAAPRQRTAERRRGRRLPHDSAGGNLAHVVRVRCHGRRTRRCQWSVVRHGPQSAAPSQNRHAHLLAARKTAGASRLAFAPRTKNTGRLRQPFRVHAAAASGPSRRRHRLGQR
jgi:hypothetical protein